MKVKSYTIKTYPSNLSSKHLDDEVGRGDVSGQGAEVDPHPPLLVGRQLGVVLVVEGDAGEGTSDGCWVTGVHLFEDD